MGIGTCPKLTARPLSLAGLANCARGPNVAFSGGGGGGGGATKKRERGRAKDKSGGNRAGRCVFGGRGIIFL